MATNIKLKKSSVAGKIPDSSDLEYGELALNYADGLIYYKNSSNSVALINASGSGGGTDSASVVSLINSTVDSAYVRLHQLDIRDSSFITGIVDQAYIQARDRIRDSGFVQDIVDSAYVQLHQSAQDLQYSSLTGAPTALSSFANDTDYLDSNTVLGVINSTYIQANQTNYLDSALAISLVAAQGYVTDALDSSEALALIATQGYVTDALDSSEAIALIATQGYLTDAIDSARVISLVAGQGYLTDALDSSEAIALIATQGYLTDALDSAEAIALIATQGYLTDALDSSEAIALIATQGYSALASPALTGTPTAPTASAATNTTQIATTAYVTSAVDNLIDGAPGTLNTLNEIAAALNDDDSAYGTLVTLIGTKTSFDSADANGLITSYGYSTFDSAEAIQVIAGEGYLTDAIDSARVISLVAGQGYLTDALDSAEAIALIATQGYLTDALDSAEAIALIATQGYLTDALDSAEAIALIATQGYLTDALDSSEAITLIATQGYLTDAIDSARIASMLAADSFSIGGTIIGDGKIEIFNETGSTPSYVDLYCEVSNAHYTRIQSAAHSAYGGNVTITTPTSTGTIALTSDVPSAVSELSNDAGYLTDAIDSARVISLVAGQGYLTDALDSAEAINLIDSAYVAARSSASAITVQDEGSSLSTSAQIINFVGSGVVATGTGTTKTITISGGGSSGGVDSATVLGLIDSAYITSRYEPSISFSLTQFEYVADSGQTTFTGNDVDGNSLAYSTGNVLVHLNGILLTDSADYTATNGSAIVLTTAAADSDLLSVYNFGAVNINARLDSAQAIALIATQGYLTDALDSSEAIALIATQGYLTDAIDSGEVINLIDSAYVAARSSSASAITVQDEGSSLTTAAQIINFVGSGVVASGTGTTKTITIGGGSSGGLDSAAILSLIDSDYIGNRATINFTLGQFEYLADSGQTAFTGNDVDGNALAYSAGNILVHLNGILLTDSADYTATNGTSITLISAADSADLLSIYNFGAESVVDNSTGLDSAETIALIATQGYLTDALDSAEAIALIATQGYLTDALDSSEAIALIATQGYLTDALDSSEAIALIATQGYLTDTDVDYSMMLTQQGTLSTTTGTARWYAPYNIATNSIKAYVETAPVGSALSIDIKKNGTSAATPSISDGAVSATEITSAVSLTAGDYLTVDITGVGSSTAGENLNIVFKYKRT